MSLAAAAPAYKPGDLSRLLAPSAGAPPVLAAAAASDPTLFGYLRPTKGRPPSRKSAKGGGKFSKQTLAKKASIKKQEAKKQQERHKQEVTEAAARKAAIKEAKSASGRPKVAPAAASAAAAAADEDADDDAAAEEEDQSEGSGLDESDGDEADDVDEAAIEEFMKDIEADGDDAAASEDESDDGEDEDPEAKAKRERIAKREKRLAEDEQMEAPLPRKKDLKRAREEARTNDPRLPRTIFVGNVPTALKTKKLGHWVEEQLGVDSAVSQSIIESVRYRSVAVADPKIPKRVAVQKGLFHEARDSLNAYVVFTEAAGETFVARAVKELTGKDIELDGKKWRIRVDRVGGAEGAAAASEGAEMKKDDAHSVFVGNLPFSVNENDLYAHFDSCGALLGVRVVRDRDSQLGKGIAFLRFSDAQSVRNALAFHGTKFGAGERTLRVMRAVENKKLHQAADTGASSKKKGGAAGSSAAGAAAGSNKKAGGAGGSNKKEGYGGTHKVKEVNRAGVLKKPRHKPRDGTAAVVQPVGRAPEAAGAAAAAGAGAAAARPAPPVAGKKRAFEGEHADPTTVVKRARVEQVKKMERKEKKRDNKKL